MNPARPTVAAGCAVTRHQESTGAYVDDTVITTRVNAKLNGVRVRRPIHLSSGDQVQVHQRRLLFISEGDYLAEDEGNDHPATVAG